MAETLNVFDYEENTCKGVVARYRQSTYKKARGSFVLTEEFILLRRESCPGCKWCGGILDSLEEDYLDDRPIIHSGLTDGDKVRLYIFITGRDCETGYADDWYVKDIKVKENGI